MACTDTDRCVRYPAEPERHVRLLRASHFGESALEAIVGALVIERLVAGPHMTQHLEVFVSASISLVVTEPVAVAALIGVDAAGNDVQPQPPPSEIVESGGGAGGERWRDEAGAMCDQEFQSLGLVRAVLRYLKSLCRRRRVSDQHGIVSGRFVGARKRREELRIDTAADDVYGGLCRRCHARPDSGMWEAASHRRVSFRASGSWPVLARSNARSSK